MQWTEMVAFSDKSQLFFITVHEDCKNLESFRSFHSTLLESFGHFFVTFDPGVLTWSEKKPEMQPVVPQMRFWKVVISLGKLFWDSLYPVSETSLS
jgi:hypothetical protein